MAEDRDPPRRRFVKLCASLVALAGASPALLAGTEAVARRYHRVRLVDPEGRPVAPDHLEVGENYLFHYPYVSTPCFLLDLGRPTRHRANLTTEGGERYEWTGGVGPQRSIVAFSAICAHKMSHPAREVSFINYRHEPVRYTDGEQSARRAQVIYCCSEKSVYDPLDGARVLSGPAKQPLAAILLEQGRDGGLEAVGTYGGEMFDRFFREFGFRLALELQTSDIRAEVRETATVLPLADYCRTQVLC
ncbi:(2Fe-2S)-binding protein [Sulfurifustis variabilis]|uniref:(2Fe-2S)-binding protein n=1 Tax=Sulfurifustis variabilis TaxID=1675686 RepID=A0A1B4V5Z8_9GAMM|nr:hypothetical protein [Sulfurifustis variabilis]BAU48875.1 (2Fe-2S)-binding protein [Sulfurifustis variabilis]